MTATVLGFSFNELYFQSYRTIDHLVGIIWCIDCIVCHIE